MSKPINISASRGAAILGLSKWKTQAHAVLEIIEERNPGFCKKNKYELPEFDQDAAVLRWGHAFESAIIELAEQKTGNEIICREELHGMRLDGKRILTEKDMILTCHIDGKYMMTDELHEGKTTSIFNFNENYGEPGTDQVPIELQIQAQHQMICTGAEKVIPAVLIFPKRVDDWDEMGWEVINDEDYGYKLVFNNDNNPISPNQWARNLNEMGYFHQYEITANPELQKIMIEHYTEIWNNHIVPCIPIKPTTYDDVKMLVTEPFGTIVADEEMERIVNVYKNIKSEISTTGDLAKQANLLKVKILKYMKKNAGDIIDDDSEIKFILRDRAGKKLASYGKDKNGRMVYR